MQAHPFHRVMIHAACVERACRSLDIGSVVPAINSVTCVCMFGSDLIACAARLPRLGTCIKIIAMRNSSMILIPRPFSISTSLLRF